MKLFCKKCKYERENLGEYEDYECPICNSILNENKEEFFNNFENETIGLDEAIHSYAINSFIKDIKKIGKERVWKVIEGLNPAIVRLRYRKIYFLALEEIKKEGVK